MTDAEKTKLIVYIEYCELNNLKPNRGLSVIKFLRFLEKDLVNELFFK